MHHVENLTVSGAQDPIPTGRDPSIDLPGVGVPAMDNAAEEDCRCPVLPPLPRIEGNLGVATNAYFVHRRRRRVGGGCVCGVEVTIDSWSRLHFVDLQVTLL